MPELTEYIRCHIVKACPMTHGDYYKRTDGTVPYGYDQEEGYLVVYPDGYESWCPRAQFEAASSPDALYKVLEHFHNERYSDVAKRDETELTHDLCLAYYKVFVTHSDQIDVKALLNRVHDFLGKLCREGRCGEYCSACLEASDLADDVHDAIHKNVW